MEYQETIRRHNHQANWPVRKIDNYLQYATIILLMPTQIL
jgi:hypothetical protein